MLNTPVALFIFNRPDLTEIVFNEIRKIKPLRLLIIADGPRFIEEQEKCFDARNIIKTIDWDCDIYKNFSDINLGCRERVFSGLNWVFSQVEEAIILEDDCLPSPSFFYFCQNLLEKYRYDERIMSIGGTCTNGDLVARHKYSYYFSQYTEIWGWASWRRAWQYYDVEMKTWSNFKASEQMKMLFDSRFEEVYWTSIFDKVFNKKIDTWDYQWLYACLLQRGLCVIPCVNLIKNIGFRDDATHTLSANSPLANLPLEKLEGIIHPPFIVRHKDADSYTFEYVFGGKKQHKFLDLKSKFYKKICDFYSFFFAN